MAEQRAHPGRARRRGRRPRAADRRRASRARPARRAQRRASRSCSASTTQGPLFAVDEDPLREGRVPMVGSGGVRGEPPAGLAASALSLRQAAAMLPQAEGGLVAYAAALLNWHRRHRFCSACGHESDIVEGGLTRLCPNCGAEHHPRTDPVVIMLVTDGDRLMLGRQASWPTAATRRSRASSSPARRSRRRSRARCWEEAGVRRRAAALRRLAAVAVPRLADARVQRAVRERRAASARRRAAGRALVRARRDRGRGGRGGQQGRLGNARRSWRSAAASAHAWPSPAA